MAFKDLSERKHPMDKSFGDAEDTSVFNAHVTPKQPEYVTKMVGGIFSLRCYLMMRRSGSRLEVTNF